MMHKRKTLYLAAGICFIFFFSSGLSLSEAVTVTSDTVWKGEVMVSEDILVPAGVTLTIAPGTVIKIAKAESTKIDPEYFSSLTEITVRGALKAEGTGNAPISFRADDGNGLDLWAGILIDGGKVTLKFCSVQNAETGVYITGGSLSMENSFIKNNRYGLVAQGAGTDVKIGKTKITGNSYGLFSLSGARVDSRDSVVKDNSKKDNYFAAAAEQPSPKEYKAEDKEIDMRLGDFVMVKSMVWGGRVRIDGIVRVPDGKRLIIMPGTVVEFTKKDTSGSGIGENGLLVQGIIIARGTRDKPVIFRSAEKDRKMGDWDAINIMNSDYAQNIIEYCQIQDAYRGLHFHFSNVVVKNSIFRNNYRGMQFQESVAEISGNYIYGNKSGIQSRDSQVALMKNHIFGNQYGANFFRVALTAKENEFSSNRREGMRIREGLPMLERNIVDGNRYGIMVSDATTGYFTGNVISRNLEFGMHARGIDNTEIRGNLIQGNGFNGLNIQEGRAIVRENHISENGERGLGLQTFDGIVTGNNFINNGLYALGLEGEGDVQAPENWWGSDDVQRVIYDKGQDSHRGRVYYEPYRKEPFKLPALSLTKERPADAKQQGRKVGKTEE